MSILTLFRKTRRWAFPAADIDLPGSYATRALRVFIITVVLALVAFLVIGVPLVVVKKVAATYIGLAELLVALAAAALVHWGRVRLAGWCYLTGSWVLVTIVVALSGGLSSVSCIFYLAFIVTAGWLLGERPALLIAALSLGAGLVMTLLQMGGTALPRYFPLPPLSAWSVLFLAVVLTIAPMGLVLRSLREALTLTQRQVLDLTFAGEALKISEQRYRSFVTMSTEGVYRGEVVPPLPLTLPEREQAEWIRQHSRVAECNEAYARQHGCKIEEMIGRRVVDFTMDDPEVQIEFILRFIRSRYRITDGETMELSSEGKARWFLSNATGIIQDGYLTGGWATQRDITLLKAAEQALLKANDDLSAKSRQRSALLEFNNALVANLNRAALFKTIGESLSKILESDWTILVLSDPLSGPTEVIVLAQSPDVPSVTNQFRALVKEKGSSVGLAGKGYAFTSNLAEECCEACAAELMKFGARSYMAVPLSFHGKPCGSLGLISRKERHYSEDDALFLLQVAQQVGLAIGNVFAYEQISELKSRLEQENVQLREVIRTEHEFHGIIGESPAIRKVMADIETVAPTGATVLILGESGTGKELVAQAVHHLSLLSDKPLITVDCAALAPGVIESELFGHEKGAFTGAIRSKPGRFELANEGTIFLDEIGDLPLELQGKLLRVLQQGEFERVGGTKTLKVKVRVIAATNRNLAESVKTGAFRSDLYYRLNVFPIRVPPLRDRRSDIPLLAQFFLDKCSRKLGKTLSGLSSGSINLLSQHDWPGNIRELQHVIERAAIMARRPLVHVLPSVIRHHAAREPAAVSTKLEDVERLHILRILESTDWVIEGDRGAAVLLHLHPNTLRYRMKKLGIERPSQAGLSSTAQSSH